MIEFFPEQAIGNSWGYVPSFSENSKADFTAKQLATAAVEALIAEAVLTPKPALVDARGSGAHKDLSLEILLQSAWSLRSCFYRIAEASFGSLPSQELREELARIGRAGEEAMYRATGGSNAHKGAIWAIGLLIAGAASCDRRDPRQIAALAAKIARYRDRMSMPTVTNGGAVIRKYGVAGARGEAQSGFPHVIKIGLPVLHEARRRGVSEGAARLDTLLAIMTELDDTCLLHRAGVTGLTTAKRGAFMVLRAGGSSTPEGQIALELLDRDLMKQNASPGGSADLLAATLFLDSLMLPSAEIVSGTEGSRKDASNEF